MASGGDAKSGTIMRSAVFSTQTTPPADRADRWTQAIAEAYFPLHLTFRAPTSFNGVLQRCTLGDVALSRLTSDALQYERRRHQIAGSGDEEYLITLPRGGAVEFSQFGREVRCDPGGFLIERGCEPYRFLYTERNDLYVLKVSRSALTERLRDPDRFCARVFGATSGIGSLFAGLVERAAVEADAASERTAEVLGRHMLELLALTLEEAGESGPSALSSVRAAHLRRIEGFVHANLRNPALSPDLIAERCGISKRYLHELFKDMNVTVSQFVREAQLVAARDLLALPGGRSIADIAYQFGFSDQAQFSRLFRARFQQTPSGYRAALQHGLN